MGWWEPGNPAVLATGARAGFEQTWDHPAELVATAPGRVNLIGEHTDYNGGLALPLALPHATYAAVRGRRDQQVRIASAQAATLWVGTLADCGRATGWVAYVAGMVWALSEAGWPMEGLDLRLDSTVPIGAGLSSSASIECATGAAVAGLCDFDLTDPSVADAVVAAGIRAETEVAGAPTGGMDQTVSVYAAAETALLLDFATGSRAALPLNLTQARLSLVAIDTGVTHALSDGSYATRRDECARAARALGRTSLRDADRATVERIADPVARRRARHVVTENARVEAVQAALVHGEVDTIGPVLVASHTSLREDFEVSCPELDLVVDASVAAGALGARMTGGGFGGSAVALVPTPALEQVRSGVAAAAARAGYPVPRFLRVQPSVGARILP